MKLLDLTLPTPAENLALDEALLDAAEAGELIDEVLRLWETAGPMVVLGRSSHAAEEVNLEACRAMNVPVLRRSSGGAAIVAGPGCLMYSVVLRYKGRQHLRMIDQVHEHVLGIVASAIAKFVPGVDAAAPATWRSAVASSRATACAASESTCSITARCSMHSTCR